MVESSVPEEWVVHRAMVRGLVTAWRQAGPANAPILLCLHGFPDVPEVWSAQERFFADRFQIVAPYARGVGPSEPSPDPSRYRRDAAALDVLAILREVDPEGRRPIVLFGHDLGVVRGTHLAPLLGGRLQRAVFFNGLSLGQMARRLRRPSQVLRSWYIGAFLVPGLADSFLDKFPRTALALARRIDGSPRPTEAEALSVSQALPVAIREYRAFAREIPGALRHNETKIKCPVLVLWGVRDRFLVTPTQDEWRRIAPQSEIRLLEAGHWPFREKAATVNELCDEFLGPVAGGKHGARRISDESSGNALPA